MKRELIPQPVVLAWLLEHHPQLHANAEIERAWVWVCADLRGDNNKATRESIKEYGFRFCKQGHTLPCGKVAMWAHACEKPIGFKRKSKETNSSPRANGGKNHAEDTDQELSPEEQAMLV